MLIAPCVYRISPKWNLNMEFGSIATPYLPSFTDRWDYLAVLPPVGDWIGNFRSAAGAGEQPRKTTHRDKIPGGTAMVERLLGFPQCFALGGRLQRSQRAQGERTAGSGRTRDDSVIHSVGDVRYIDHFPLA